MAIFFVVGKPGGGKSYYGVKQVVEELARGNRYIVSNIEFNLPEVRAWCHENIEAEVDLTDRFRILDENETAQFWLYEPGRDFTKRKDIKQGTRIINVPDFEDRAKRGCLYVIDEVHTFFGAREWQGTGTDCTYFLSQHRKLRCDIILITQHPDQVDKALRRLAQDYVHMRNLSREPIFGFRVGSVFRWSRSLNSPTGGNPRVFESGFLKLDCEGLGKLYDTMAGVGIQGRVEATVEKKGRSLWWLLLPVTAVVLLVLFGPHLLMKGTQIGIRKAMTKMFGAAATNPGAGVQVHPVVRESVPSKPISAAPGIAAMKRRSYAGVNMTGFCLMPDGSYRIVFADGTTISTRDRRVERLTPQYCIVNGVLHWLVGEVGANPADPLPVAPIALISAAAIAPLTASTNETTMEDPQYHDIPSVLRVRIAPLHSSVTGERKSDR